MTRSARQGVLSYPQVYSFLEGRFSFLLPFLASLIANLCRSKQGERNTVSYPQRKLLAAPLVTASMLEWISLMCSTPSRNGNSLGEINRYGSVSNGFQ